MCINEPKLSAVSEFRDGAGGSSCSVANRVVSPWLLDCAGQCR